VALRIPKAIHQELIQEFRTAVDKMKEVPDLPSKLYFFSAMYGAVSRANNVAWTNELALVHLALQGAHSVIGNRSNQMKGGQDFPIQLPEELPGRLTEVADKLATIIVADEIDEAILFDILAELATLSYTASGNGYYLYLKGDLSV